MYTFKKLNAIYMRVHIKKSTINNHKNSNAFTGNEIE